MDFGNSVDVFSFFRVLFLDFAHKRQANKPPACLILTMKSVLNPKFVIHSASPNDRSCISE